MNVVMRNKVGLTRKVKVGFSWTAFFFGGFPFFFRGLPVHGIIWIILAILTLGLSNLVLMFIINKLTVHYYLENGYEPIGENWEAFGITRVQVRFHENRGSNV